MNSYEIVHPDFQELVDVHVQPELIRDGFEFTEGPVWHARDRCLYFSDIPADTLYRYTEKAGVEVVYHPSGYSNGLTLDSQGAIIACEHRTRAITRYSDTGKHILASTYQGKKLNSPNDLVISRNGTLYFTDPIYGLREGNGGPAEQELNFQGLYSYRDGWKEPYLESRELERPNGVAFSSNPHILYAIDTVKQQVLTFKIDENGHLSGKQVWLELRGAGEGRPDGMKFDARDNLFCTGPQGIWVFRSDGELLGKIKFPLKTANLAFGGEDRTALFVTSSHSLYRLTLKTNGFTPLDLY